MVLITIVNGIYKPTYNWGAPHCIPIISPSQKSPGKSPQLQMCRTMGSGKDKDWPKKAGAMDAWCAEADHPNSSLVNW